MTLLDSNGKKTAFLQQAAIELGLKNVQVVTARVEEFKPAAPFAGLHRARSPSWPISSADAAPAWRRG